jgi:hypothetical protein
VLPFFAVVVAVKCCFNFTTQIGEIGRFWSVWTIDRQNAKANDGDWNAVLDGSRR